MYCPNCKQEFPGKFCPECGTKLVESPKQNDFGVNISDDAAIMGGINVTRNESHNTTSYDHRVINTSNVTNNIVERQKTDAELRNERNIKFMELCKEVFKDGLLDEEEKRMLNTERIRLGIDETEAARLIEMARKSSMTRMTTLGMRDSMTLNTIDNFIKANKTEVLVCQIPRLAALARNYKVDEVLYRYYMLLAALQPEGLISEYETNVADEYWKTYWAAIAYMKTGDTLNAEEAIVKLDLYPEYSEDNSLLLSAVSTLREFGAESAEGYISAILPEHCSSLLMPFIHALFLEASPERAAEIGADKDKCQFYIDNLVNLESHEEKVARKELVLKLLNGKYGFADENGNIVIPLKYDDAEDFSEGLALVKLNGKYGFIDKSGKEVIPFKYDYAYDFSEGLAPVVLNDKWGFIDKSGKEVTPLKYDDAENFSEGLAVVVLNDKCGFIDKSGKEVTPLKYDDAGDFFEGRAEVELNGEKFYIDKKGNRIVYSPERAAEIGADKDKCQFYIDNLVNLESHEEKVARKELVLKLLNGKYGFADENGNIVIPPKYDDARDFSEGLALVVLNDKYGFIDKNGYEVIPLKYDRALSFSEGLASVKLNDKWSFIDKTDKEVIPLKYDRALSFSEGLAMVRLNRKSGFIDKTGKEVIPVKYSDAGDFSEGLAMVRLIRQYGFIDKTGKEVIPLKYYDDAKDFSEGLVRVKLNDKWGYIDKSGNEVIPFKYDDAEDFSEGLASVKLKGKWGFVDKSGYEVIPLKYHSAYSFRKEGIAMVGLNGKLFFIDKQGNRVD